MRPCALGSRRLPEPSIGMLEGQLPIQSVVMQVASFLATVEGCVAFFKMVRKLIKKEKSQEE